VDALGQWTSGDPLPVVEIRDQSVTVDVALRLLWNCCDVLPHMLVDDVNELLCFHVNTELRRFSYAAASPALVAICRPEASASL
jgi:hypothetical protein